MGGRQKSAKVKTAAAAAVKSAPVVEGFFTRRRVGTAVSAVLALLLFYTVIFGKNGVLSYARKRHESVVLAKQIDQLQQENELLKEETARLAQDPSAIEHQAREELHYTRPGEVIYTLPASPVEQPATVKK
jgi:cell division protein FtsB